MPILFLIKNKLLGFMEIISYLRSASGVNYFELDFTLILVACLADGTGTTILLITIILLLQVHLQYL